MLFHLGFKLIVVYFCCMYVLRVEEIGYLRVIENSFWFNYSHVKIAPKVVNSSQMQRVGKSRLVKGLIVKLMPFN